MNSDSGSHEFSSKSTNGLAAKTSSKDSFQFTPYGKEGLLGYGPLPTPNCA